MLVEYDARRHQLPGVRLHLSRRFSAADIHPGRALPTVRIERAIVDAASWMAPARKACAVMCAAVQQRLTTAERLRPESLAASRARHHHLLTQILGDIEGGADSFSEIDFAHLMERQNDMIVVTGKPALRFASVAIRIEPTTVVAQLRAAGERFGFGRLD